VRKVEKIIGERDTVRCIVCAKRSIRFISESDICICRWNRGGHISEYGRNPMFFTLCPYGALMVGEEFPV